MSEDKETVTLDRARYIALLDDVVIATEKLHSLRAKEIEEWKEDDASRLATIQEYIDVRLEVEFASKYEEYLKSLKAKPIVKWWNRTFGISPKVTEEKKSEFSNLLEFIISSLEKSGRNLEDFRKMVLKGTAGKRPWEVVQLILKYEYAQATRNEWDHFVYSAHVERDNVRRGCDATFTVSRMRYNRYTERLLMADAKIVPWVYESRSQ